MLKRIFSILEKFIKKEEEKNPENKLVSLLENLEKSNIKLR